MNNSNMNFNEKIAIATLQMFEKYPMLYHIYSQIEKYESKEIETACVALNKKSNRISMMINKDFIDKLNINETSIVLTHEMYHILLMHLNNAYNLKLINSYVLNIARDLYINENIQEFVVLGEDVSWLKKNSIHKEMFKDIKEILNINYKNILISEIYNILIANQDKIPEELKSIQFYHSALEDIINSNTLENIRLTEEIKKALAKTMSSYDSSSSSMKSGNLPAEVERLIKLYQVKFNWRKTLSIFTTSLKNSQYESTWKKRSRRYGTRAPGNKSVYNPSLLVAIDTSGSIGEDMLNMFFSYVKTLLNICESIILVDCDAKINNVVNLNKKSSLPKLNGGGGTLFQPVFDLARSKKIDGVLYFTDMQNYENNLNQYNIKTAWVTTQENVNLMNNKHGRVVMIEKT